MTECIFVNGRHLNPHYQWLTIYAYTNPIKEWSKLKCSLKSFQKLAFAYFSQNGICDSFQVDTAIIGQIVEDIGSTDSLRTSLTISKDKINPMM